MLTFNDLRVGRFYTAKKPKNTFYRDDRQIVSIGTKLNEKKGCFEIYVQYDSPKVAFGRRYPKVSLEKFLKWADKDVTDEVIKNNFNWVSVYGEK